MRFLRHVGALRTWYEIRTKFGVLSYAKRPSGQLAVEFEASESVERWFVAGDPREWAAFYRSLGDLLQKEGVDVSSGCIESVSTEASVPGELHFEPGRVRGVVPRGAAS